MLWLGIIVGTGKQTVRLSKGRLVSLFITRHNTAINKLHTSHKPIAVYSSTFLSAVFTRLWCVNHTCSFLTLLSHRLFGTKGLHCKFFFFMLHAVTASHCRLSPPNTLISRTCNHLQTYLLITCFFLNFSIIFIRMSLRFRQLSSALECAFILLSLPKPAHVVCINGAQDVLTGDGELAYCYISGSTTGGLHCADRWFDLVNFFLF